MSTPIVVDKRRNGKAESAESNEAVEPFKRPRATVVIGNLGERAICYEVAQGFFAAGPFTKGRRQQDGGR